MKKLFFTALLFVLLTACKQSITDKDIVKINGYWEIQKVELPNGEKKDYKVNETIDFFQVKNNKGFRQKVMPQFDGSYLTNGLKEAVSVFNENGDYYIDYVTQYGKWKEEIIEIKDSSLVLKNKENLEYHYKRQIPFSVK